MVPHFGSWPVGGAGRLLTMALVVVAWLATWAASSFGNSAHTLAVGRGASSFGKFAGSSEGWTVQDGAGTIVPGSFRSFVEESAIARGSFRSLPRRSGAMARRRLVVVEFVWYFSAARPARRDTS